MIYLLVSLFASFAEAKPPKVDEPMRAVDALSLSAPPDKARVVFLRSHRGYASDIPTFWLDSASPDVLGILHDNMAMAVDVAPGAHRFCGMSIVGATWVPGALASGVHSAGGVFGGVGLDADLEAGKTYLMDIKLFAGLVRPASPRLTVIPSGSSAWRAALKRLPKIVAVEPIGPLGGLDYSDAVFVQCEEQRSIAPKSVVSGSTVAPGHGEKL